MFLAGNIAADKNAQMPHAFVQHINDGAPGGGNGTLITPGVNDPVQRLRWRRDVVTPGCKHHNRRGDVVQVNGAVARLHGAAGQAVADK